MNFFEDIFLHLKSLAVLTHNGVEVPSKHKKQFNIPYYTAYDVEHCIVKLDKDWNDNDVLIFIFTEEYKVEKFTYYKNKIFYSNLPNKLGKVIEDHFEEIVEIYLERSKYMHYK